MEGTALLTKRETRAVVSRVFAVHALQSCCFPTGHGIHTVVSINSR